MRIVTVTTAVLGSLLLVAIASLLIKYKMRRRIKFSAVRRAQLASGVDGLLPGCPLD